MVRYSIFHMSKHNIAVALFGLLLIVVSCQREDIPKADSENMPIEFSGVTAWLDTKADGESTTSVLPSGNFKVWAHNSSNYSVFGTSGTVVSTSDAGSTWTYSPVRYWKPGTYNFYAVSPDNKATGTLSEEGLKLSFEGGWDLASEQTPTDLLLATQTVDGSTQVNKDGGPGKVSLTFNHMLSQISFSARNADQTDGVELAVTGVKIYGNSSAALELTGTVGTNGGFNTAWRLDNTAKTTQALPFENHSVSPAKTLTKDKTVSQETTTYSYTGILPRTLVFPETCNLTVEVTFNQMKDGITSPATKSATINGASWQPGYNYDYKLTVTADAIKIDSDPDVTLWGEGGSADTSVGSTDKPIEF